MDIENIPIGGVIERMETFAGEPMSQMVKITFKYPSGERYEHIMPLQELTDMNEMITLEAILNKKQRTNKINWKKRLEVKK